MRLPINMSGGEPNIRLFHGQGTYGLCCIASGYDFSVCTQLRNLLKVCITGTWQFPEELCFCTCSNVISLYDQNLSGGPSWERKQSNHQSCYLFVYKVQLSDYAFSARW